MMGGIVPAFFSPDRAQVVFESNSEVLVMDIPSRRVRSLGPGIAPRVVPFSNHFVFLREISRNSATGGRSEVGYGVLAADFAGGEAAPVGELRATGEASVRRMVVAEVPEGFVLRGEGIRTFALPARVWSSAAGGGNQ